MTGRGERQRGQVAVIFALMAVLIVGIVALAVDYGLLVNHHRNLQAFVDEAASAGAAQLPASPTTSDRINARKVAWEYLRDNLMATSDTTLSVANLKCGSGSPVTYTAVDWSSDLVACQLPANSSLSNYTVSILTPVQNLQNSIPNTTWTLQVSLTEAVATAVASVIGSGTVQAGASATAFHNFDQQFPWALYSDGCVTTGNQIATVQGDVFIDNCTVNPQSSGNAALCVYGNLDFGPLATPPLVLLPNVSPATCGAGAAGQVLATGSAGTSSQSLPALISPIVPTGGNYTCLQSPPCSAAAPGPAGNCVNHAPYGAGEVVNSCFQPGAYTTLPNIQNNLNPGIYVITGDDPTCTSVCNGAMFAGNTLNADWRDTNGQCWAAPNVPSTDTFTPPCVNGYTMSPTAPADPMCPVVAPIPPPPGIAYTPLSSGGSLDPTGNPIVGTTYYVVVTATTNTGETNGVEQAVVVFSAGSKKGSIKVAIPAEPGATGYNIYGPSTAPGGEILYQHVGSSGTYTLTNVPAGPASGPPPSNTSGNSPLANPTFAMTAYNAGVSGTLTAGTYYVRVTALDPMGETLSSEQSVTVANPNNAITVNITPRVGATGYEVYGPSTTSNDTTNERAYTAATPTVAQPFYPLPATVSTNLLGLPTAGTPSYPQWVNRSGCTATGFYNIPTRPSENDGVTLVFLNNAGVCLNVNNTGASCTNGVGSSTPVVLWSPAQQGANCNPATGDGIYPVYSATGGGSISSQGISEQLGMSGTVYGPNMTLDITQNAVFALYGQLIIHSTNIQTGNQLNPTIYDPYSKDNPNPCLAGIPTGVRLIQ